MFEYVVVREYPYLIEEVWEVMTDPQYVRQWTVTGRGGRPDGYVPEVGNTFRLVGKPMIGWAGIVYCEVQEVEPPRRLHYTWKDDAASTKVTDVRYQLEPTARGTRLTLSHTGFTGPGGFAMSKLLGRVRRTMLDDGLPPVLAAYHASHTP